MLVGLASSGIPYLQESAQQRSLIGVRCIASAQDLLQQTTQFFPAAPEQGRALFPSAANAETGKQKKAKKEGARKLRETIIR